MKNSFIYLAVLVSLISYYSFSQRETDTIIDISPTSIRTIISYYVEENIYQKFGGHTTTYKVSNLNLIDIYDLGPNNKRIITPIYGETKQTPIKQIILNKKLLKSTKLSDLVLINKNKLQPLSIDVTIPCLKDAENEIITENKNLNKTINSEKYLYIYLIKTYERIAEKGCKSIEIFQKLGDAYFFDGDYVKAVKWYEELFKMTIDLESEYFERFAYSLRALGENEKANEIIKLLNQTVINKNEISL